MKIKHSIIIPTAGRPNAIKTAIESLLANNLDLFNAEVIVVDNNQDSALASEIFRYCESFKKHIRYVRELSPGLSAARHRGASEASGEILSFIDDDVEVSEKWLPAIQAAFLNPFVGLVGGPSIPKFESSIPLWFWDFISRTPYGGWMNSWLSLIDIGKDVDGIDPNFIWGLNFSIRKSLMYECGGFHPDLVPAEFKCWQGDGETGLTMKVHKLGFRADYRNEALLTHSCGSERLTEEYFKRRAYFQGICNSFTSIRLGRDPVVGSNPPGWSSYRQSLRRRFWYLSRGISLWRSPAVNIKRITDNSFLEGWKFHQNQVFNSANLLAWVRRENFIDIDIRTQKIGSNQ
jgi:glycosyltransferase involved in cell wall biosynthesis